MAFPRIVVEGLARMGVVHRVREAFERIDPAGGALTDRLLRRSFPIYRARATGTYRSTVEMVFPATEPGEAWLSAIVNFALGAAIARLVV